MNIVINAVFSDEKPRGPGRYANNLIAGFAKLDATNQYFIYYGSWMKEYSFLNIKQDNFHFIELDIQNNVILRNLYLAFILPLIIRKHVPDVFMLLDTQAILIKPCVITSTIHDLAEFEVPEKYSKAKALIRREIVKKQVKLSEYIFTVSEYSKKCISERFHISADRIEVTYNNCYLQINDTNKQPEKYFLFVGEVERAKNLSTLIHAFSLLSDNIKEEFKVIVVGRKGNDYEASIDLIKKLALSKNFIFHGYAYDNELVDLYSKCYAFIFPSIFEGFGLPVLEAMAMKAPVICSNASSIPEVGGDAALYFEPNDFIQLMKHMELLIQHPEVRKEMIAKGEKQVKKFQINDGIKKTHSLICKLMGA